MSLFVNQTCLNERLLPTHTHTHTHIYIYIYIYILECIKCKKLSSRCRVMAKGEFLSLETAEKSILFLQITEGMCWAILNSNLLVARPKVTFLIRLGGKSALDLGTTRKLTELKHQLTDLLICSISSIDVLPTRSNARYTGYFSGPNLALVEDCIHL